MRTRLDGLVEEPSTLLAALELESDLTTDQRLSILREHVIGSALPWLQARETEEKARTALMAETRPTGLVTLVAKKRLGIAGAP